MAPDAVIHGVLQDIKYGRLCARFIRSQRSFTALTADVREEFRRLSKIVEAGDDDEPVVLASDSESEDEEEVVKVVVPNDSEDDVNNRTDVDFGNEVISY